MADQRIFQHPGAGIEFGHRQVVGRGIDPASACGATAKRQLLPPDPATARVFRAAIELDTADNPASWQRVIVNF